VAGADLFRRRVLLAVVVVLALDVRRRDDRLGPQRLDVNQQVADLALLGNLEIALVRVEVARHLGVAGVDLGAEAIGGEADDGELHLVVAAAIFLFELRVVDRQPIGQRAAQLLDRQAVADVVLELRGDQRRPLHAQQLLIPRFADEAAVLLERRHREDPLPHFLVAHLDPDPFGFGERGALVDHLLQNLLLDAELLQQLIAHVVAVGRAVGLQLSLIGAPEIGAGDFPAFDLRDSVAGRGVGTGAAQKIRDVKKHKRHAHQAQAPLEPVPVAAHPIEHGH